MLTPSRLRCRAGLSELRAVFAALTQHSRTRAAAGLCGERRPERTPPHACISRGTPTRPAARARRGGGGAVRRDGASHGPRRRRTLRRVGGGGEPAHHRSTYNYTSPVEDLASFLIVRGPHAWCAPSLCLNQAGESFCFASPCAPCVYWYRGCRDTGRCSAGWARAGRAATAIRTSTPASSATT